LPVYRIISTTALALTCLLARTGIASAEEIRVWTARALATVLAEVGLEFERTMGHRLTISSDLPGGFQRRANAGEQFDLFISASASVDEWIKEGRLIAQTRTDVARSGIGVAVRAGSRKPDISSVEAFKRALLDAKSIAYLKVGSGLYMDGLVKRLGIAEAVTPKVTRPDTDIVCELVARGEIDLGIVVITQILTTPGVDLVGPLPAAIQSHVMFTAGVSAKSKAPDAARELIKFLTGPTAIPVIRRQGMEPVSGQ
jgi:molybdate transport system substrate-binding protein